MGNVGAFTRTDVAADDGGDYRMIWGRRCFFGYTVSPDGEVWWFANPPSRRELTSDEIRGATSTQIKAKLLNLFDGDRGPAAEIIRSTPGEILLGNQYEVPPVPRWHRSRMVIIGDAAHAVSPSTGQGAPLACEDAVTLARCLRDEPDHETAFATYEQLRRDRVERIVAWGAKMGGTKTAGPLMRFVRDLALPHILAKASTPEALDKQAWMFNYRLDWALR